MNIFYRHLSSTLFFLLAVLPCNGQTGPGITIVQDVGSLNLVANSLVATTVAVSQGADYLEIPVNMSADNQLIVSRGIRLDRQTDVAELFDGRQRADDAYYAVDFTLNELRQLRQRNEFATEEPGLSLGIPSLREELALIKRLNALLHTNTGIVIDIQDPQFYRTEGKEISVAILQELVTAGFLPGDKIYLQSSDPDELQNISRWSQAEKQGKYTLIQSLVTKNDKDSDHAEIATEPASFHHWLFTNSGLRILASYAAAIALPAEMLEARSEETTQYLQSLHNYGIQVFAIEDTVESTFNQAPRMDEIADEAASPTVIDLKPDGVYTKTLEMQRPVSLETSPGAKEEDSAGGADDTTANKNTSTLPPFFSNLGLLPPQHLENTQDSEGNNEDSGKVIE